MATDALRESLRQLDFIERAILLRIDPDRARFLASCSHDQGNFDKNNRTESIPYDPAVQIAEAYRLGIGLKDTAEMMDMTIEQVAAHGLPFPEKTAFSKPPNSTRYNLLTPETIKPHVCFR